MLLRGPAFPSPAGFAVRAALHPSNPAAALPVAEVRKMFLGQTREWPNHRPVTLVRCEAYDPATAALLRDVLQMTAVEYGRHLLRVEFQGQEPLRLKTLHSAQSACEFVSNVPGAIAIVPSGEGGVCGRETRMVELRSSTRSDK